MTATHETSAPPRRAVPWRERAMLLAHHGLFVAVLVFFYVPILTLMVISFSSGRLTQFPPPGLTLHWYQAIFTEPRALQSIVSSLAVAATSSMVATGLATLFAAALNRHRAGWVGPVRALGNLPLVMAPLVIGISMLIFYNTVSLRLGFLSVTLTHIVRAFPFAATIMATAFLSVRPNHVEAALDLGATRWSAFRRVILPAIAPGLVASLLVTFAVSFDEISATVFVIGGGMVTVQTYILEQLQFVVTPEMNALTTIILVLTVALAFVAHRFRARQETAAGGDGGEA